MLDAPTQRHAIVFDIQRACIHDGPGLRTVVFFKGCALDCAWCQNPEGRKPTPELAYYEERCLPGCSRCVSRCPHDALRDRIGGRVDWAVHVALWERGDGGAGLADRVDRRTHLLDVVERVEDPEDVDTHLGGLRDERAAKPENQLSPKGTVLGGVDTIAGGAVHLF